MDSIAKYSRVFFLIVLFLLNPYRVSGYEQDPHIGFIIGEGEIIVLKEILVSKLDVHQMSTQEIIDAGVNLDDIGNYVVYNFTATFEIGEQTVTVSQPVFGGFGGGAGGGYGGSGGWGGGSYVYPPGGGSPIYIAPFIIPNPSVPSQIIPGVIVLDGRIKALKSFFKANLYVMNAAPVGSGYIIQNLTATLDPGGLTPAGSDPSTVRSIGDLQPQDQATQGFVLRGDQEGDHTIIVDLSGEIQGPDPNQPAEPVQGQVSATVTVANPEFSLSFQHPGYVKKGEPFSLTAVVTNKSSVMANQTSIEMTGYQNVTLVSGAPKQDLFDIPPGSSASATWEFTSNLEGWVISEYASIQSFGISVRIGNQPGSQSGIVIPSDAEALREVAPSLVNSAQFLLGSAFNELTDPGDVPEGIPVIEMDSLEHLVGKLAEGGQKVKMYEPLRSIIQDITMEFLGCQIKDLGFDYLRRTSNAGTNFSHALTSLYEPVMNDLGALTFQEEFASNTVYYTQISAIVTGPAARLTITDDQGNSLGGQKNLLRQISYGDFFHIGAETNDPTQFALIANPATATNYQVIINGLETGTFDLGLVLPGSKGSLIQAIYHGLDTQPGARASITVTQGMTDFALSLDLDGDGTIDSTVQPDSLLTIADSGPEVVNAVHDLVLDSNGKAIKVLFNEQVLADTAKILTNYNINGNPVQDIILDPNGRIIYLLLTNPLAMGSMLTMANIQDLAGNIMEPAAIDIAGGVPVGTVEGMVFAGDGVTPIANAQVSLQGSYSTALSTTTDGQGGYVFESVPKGNFTVKASDPVTGSRGESQYSITAAGQVATVYVTLTGMGTVSGSVFESDGVTPVPNAEVTLYGSHSTTFSATTDNSGQYVVDHVPVGSFIVDVLDPSTDDRGRATGSISMDGQEVMANVTLVGMGTVKGTVYLADGVTPAANAYVKLQSQGTFGRTFYVQTNQDGRFTVKDVFSGSFSVVAKDITGQLSGTAKGELIAGATVDVSVKLNPAGSVMGTVYMADGETPAAGAGVYLAGQYTITNAAGQYRFDLIPLGSYTIEVVSVDNGRGRTTVSPSVQGEEVGRDIVLIARGTVIGTVFDEDGVTPLPDIPVCLHNKNEVIGDFYFSTETTADGTYTIVGVHVGTLTIDAVDYARRLCDTAEGSIGSEGEVVTANLILKPTQIKQHFITLSDFNGFKYDIYSGGNLNDGTNNAYDGAYKLFINDEEFTFLSDSTVSVDESGQELTLNRQNLAGLNVTRRVFVPKKGFFARYLEVITNPTASPVSLDLKISTNLGSDGNTEIVTTSDGNDTLEVGDCFIVTDDADGSGSPSLAHVFSRLDGAHKADAMSLMGDELTYVWTGITLNPGQTVVYMHFAVQAFNRVGAIAAAETLISPPPEALWGVSADEMGQIENFFISGVDGGTPSPLIGWGVVAGTIFASDEITPVPGCSITLKSDNPIFGRSFYETSATSGAYTVNQVPIGEITAYVMHPVTKFKAQASGTLSESGQLAIIDVVFTGSGIIMGTVYEGDGSTPVPGAKIDIQGVGFSTSLKANSLGQYQLTGVPTGDFTIRASDPDTGLPGTASDTVTTSGQVVTADVTLLGAGSVTGTVFKGDGITPLAEGNVTIKSDNPDYPVERTTITDSAGKYKIDALPIGSFTVNATDPNTGVPGSVTGSVSYHGEVVTANVTLLPSGTVSGTLYADDGVTPLAGVQVHLQSDNPVKLDYYTVTDSAGQFTIPGVLVGNFTISTLDPNTGYPATTSGSISGEGEVFSSTITTVENISPEVEIISPAAGAFINTLFPEVVISYSDPSGIDLSTLTITINGVNLTSSFTLSETSASFQITAPDILHEGLNSISITLADKVGNTAQDSGTFTADVTAPTVALSYPREGSVVGHVVTVDVSYSDDVGVASVEFYVDGALKETILSPPFRWDWDTTLYSEGPHVIRVVAYDWSGNTDTDEVNVTVNQTVLSMGTDTTWESGTYTYGDVIITNGATLTFDGHVTLHANSLILTDNSILTHSSATTETTSSLELDVGTLTIDETSSIDVSGKGYLGGRQGGTDDYGRTLGNVSGSCTYTGGSYGGLGGKYENYQIAETYGDYKNPDHLGSGGGGQVPWNTEPGGNGGGLVKIKASSISLFGSIKADGGVSAERGAGSGGGIWIEGSSLQGTGIISASGGSGRCGGGGGRVAVYYDDISGFDIANITAFGGSGYSTAQNGGAGTVFLKSSAQAYGELIVDNNDLSTSEYSTPLRSVGSGTITNLSATVLTDENANFPVPDPDTGSLGLIGLELSPNIDQDKTFTIIDNTVTTITIDPADGDMIEVAAVGDRYVGVYVFDTLRVLGQARVLAKDMVEIAENGSLTVDGASLEVALLDDSAAGVVDTANGTVISTLDVVPPDIAVTYPAEGAEVTGSVTITAQASDNVGVARVAFYVDDEFKTELTATPYSWNWDITGYDLGSHLVKVIAYDAAGNTAVDELTIIVALNTPPEAPSLVSPDGGEIVDTSHTITWDAALDNEQAESELAYEIDYTSNASAAAEVQAFDMTVANGLLQSDAVNDVFVSDTTKDSDGGAWRKGGLGRFGSDALMFDGNDFVDISAISDDIDRYVNTVELWFKPSVKYDENTPARVLYSQWHRHYISYGSGNLAARISMGSWNAGWTNNFYLSYSVDLQPNNWYHIVLTFEAGNKAVLYLNGVNVREEAIDNEGLGFWGTTFSLGRLLDGSGSRLFVTGNLDEVVIYNRALTAEEVKDHYNASMGKEIVPDQSTVGLWHFNEGSGGTAIDASENGNDGTTNGATYVSKASWYDELPSETRGTRSDFPQKAYLVATDDGLNIIDAGDNSLWMRFGAVSGAQLPVGCKEVYALNGKIYLATSDGLYVIDFVNDNSIRYDTIGLAVSDRPIAERNNVNIYSTQDNSLSLIDSVVNDVHAAVIDDETYIAVATDGGVSVINENKATVSHFERDDQTGEDVDIQSVYLTNSGDLYLIHDDNTGVTQNVISVYYKAHQDTSDLLWAEHRDFVYYALSTGLSPGIIGDRSTEYFKVFVTEGTSTAHQGDNTIYVATDAGLTVIEEWQGNEGNGTAVHFGSASSVNDDIDYKILAGDTGRCTSVAVSGNTMWVGTNDDAWGGAVSQVDLATNTLLASYTTDSLSPIVSNSVTVVGGDTSNLLVGTDSGATALVGEPIWQNIVSVSDWVTTSGGVGSYDWDTSALPEGTDYKIRIRAYDGMEYGPYDESDGLFKIKHETLTDGLVAYYPVNGDANDESGNGNDGTVYGATLTTDRFGDADSAYSFDGVDDLVEVPDNPIFHFTDQMTVAAWVKPLEAGTIINKWYALDSFNLSIGNGISRFTVAFPGGDWGQSETVSAPASMGTWTHVAGVFDGENMFLYINGQLAVSQAASGTIQDSDRPISIGNHPSWDAFEGIIDEVYIYNRALSEAEVSQLYASSIP